MGWKLAIAAAPLNGGSLEQAVARIYGKPKALAASGAIVVDALCPKKGDARFAAEIGAFAWVFDWRLVEDALTRPLRYAGGASDFYYLHSAVNAYGFAHRENGAFKRLRFGDADGNGIRADVGEYSSAERAAIEAVAEPGQEMEAWAAWCDADHAYMAKDEDYTHDSMGEEVVFTLMHDRLGARLDLEEADALLKQSVFAVR